MDLVIPGEQHMYLRASTSQERQKWLVALGTAKACVQNKNRKESSKYHFCFIIQYLMFLLQVSQTPIHLNLRNRN